MSGEKLKIVRADDVSDRIKIAELPPRPGGGFISTTRSQLGDAEYVARFGTKEELAGLRKLIEERRSKMPRFSYWRCENPRCRWKGKLPYDERHYIEGARTACLRCNLPGYEKSKGWLVEMSKKEARQFDIEDAERKKRSVERIKRGALYHRNQEREKTGLPPLTLQEFEEQTKRDFQKGRRA